jgi:hypothetical protein
LERRRWGGRLGLRKWCCNHLGKNEWEREGGGSGQQREREGGGGCKPKGNRGATRVKGGKN